MGRMGAVQYQKSKDSTPHFMGRGPGRLVKTRRPRHGLGGAARVDAHISWAAARPSPPHFQFITLGPVRPIKFSHFQNCRPGPAKHIFERLSPAQPGLSVHDNPWRWLICNQNAAVCCKYHSSVGKELIGALEIAQTLAFCRIILLENSAVCQRLYK